MFKKYRFFRLKLLHEGINEVHSDKKRWLEIVSAFRISPEICSCSTYFKIQSKLTHLTKSMFQKHQIVGPYIWKFSTARNTRAFKVSSLNIFEIRWKSARNTFTYAYVP